MTLSDIKNAFEGHYVVSKHGCWLWTGAFDKHGYGSTAGRLHKIHPKAHRAAYIVAYGEIPEGAHVHHKCDIPPCINPDHLEAVTPNEHWIEHHLTRQGLTLDDVKTIRELGRTPGAPSAIEIGKQYGIWEKSVYRYWNAEVWQDVLGDGPVGKPVRTCKNCHEQFDDRHRHAIYCSKRCRQLYNGRRTYRRKHGLDPDAPGRFHRSRREAA